VDDAENRVRMDYDIIPCFFAGGLSTHMLSRKKQAKSMAMEESKVSTADVAESDMVG
jgi:hypothetical protein